MSQQGPIIVVSTAQRPSFASALDDAKMFPVIQTAWSDASGAVEQLQPAAVLVALSEAVEPGFKALAQQIAARQPYLPLIAVDPQTSLPENAIPFSQSGGNFDRLMARLRAALRIGRGAAYPSLSVSLGERMGVVGALSIEAAAKHLNMRDLDGIVLGEGFSPRVVDAFLTVLAEDARFRNLPVVVTSDELAPAYDLPNLEIISGDPERIAANAWPLIRQRAFEAHLSRTLRSIAAGGLLAPKTGLLTPAAFERDFATAVYQTLSRGGGLSVARFAFDADNARAQLDGARILSRLMRQMDFGAIQEDGSFIVVFAETDLRTAHMIARRLSSVMRHTSHGKRDSRSEPVVTLATVLPSDSAQSLLARLYDEARRAAS